MFEEIFFGTKSEADRVLAAVHRMHSTVKGELPEDAGSMPAGTPYSALDPELMLWTIAPAADSAIYFYELFVRELAEAERDEFWADYVRFGELFGMSASVAPALVAGTARVRGRQDQRPRRPPDRRGALRRLRGDDARSRTPGRADRRCGSTTS